MSAPPGGSIGAGPRGPPIGPPTDADEGEECMSQERNRWQLANDPRANKIQHTSAIILANAKDSNTLWPNRATYLSSSCREGRRSDPSILSGPSDDPDPWGQAAAAGCRNCKYYVRDGATTAGEDHRAHGNSRTRLGSHLTHTLWHQGCRLGGALSWCLRGIQRQVRSA